MKCLLSTEAVWSFYAGAEIFERIGPRERRALWDLFGAVQCELGITSRFHQRISRKITDDESTPSDSENIALAFSCWSKLIATGAYGVLSQKDTADLLRDAAGDIHPIPFRR
ncbi:hypothetical protein ABZP36_024093 [Zizania latifolia]